MEFTTKETKDGKRYYYMDGVAYPSVTTILSVIDKSGPLVGWAVRETCDYISQKAFAGKEEIFEDGKEESKIYIPYSVVEAILGQARKEATRIKREASDIGSQIHDAIHHYNTEGTIPTFEDERATKAWEAYQKWAKEHDVTVVMSEKAVFNPIYKYAGTMDMLARLTVNGERKLYLIDVKSSNTFQEVQMGAQVAAYEMCFSGSTVMPGINPQNNYEAITGLGVIRLDKTTGMPHFHDVSDKRDKLRQVFIRALDLHGALKALKGKEETA